MTYIIPGLINTHCHLRHLDPVIAAAIAECIRGGATVVLPMPNTEPWLSTGPLVVAYIEKAKSFVPPGAEMDFIPTGVISESTTIEMVEEMARLGIRDVKLYPKDRTTNSKEGIRDYWMLIAVIRRCGELGIRVHFHAEHPWMAYGNDDAEYAFLPIIDMFLRATNAIIIWEHGTDARCIPFWKEMAKTGRFYVTLTAHHLATNDNETYGNVHETCKPSIKSPSNQSLLIAFVMEDHPWVMAGGDDAPHPIEGKLKEVGKCACGDYTAPHLLSVYAHALDELLRKPRGIEIFKRFITGNAMRLYNLPEPKTLFVLEDVESEIPAHFVLGPWKVVPFWALKRLKWSHRVHVPS